MLSARLAAPLALIASLLLATAQAARPVEPGAVLAAPAATATAAGTAGAVDPSAPQPPRFPGSYTVRYIFSLPYTAKLQPDGIRYPVAFYRDVHSEAVRMDTYDSTTVMIIKKGVTYELVPRIDRQVCMAFGGGDEPTAAASDPSSSAAAAAAAAASAASSSGLLGSPSLMDALPDVRGWDFAGDAALEDGRATQVWRYTARHAAKTVVYQLHVAADGSGAPLRLHMQGNDMMSGAHFDEWIVDYTEYLPGRPDPAVFSKPALCKGVKPQAAPAAGAGGHATAPASQLRMMALVPAVAYRGEHAEYDSFLATHGTARQHGSLGEYRRRASLFAANHAMIQAHNARTDSSFKMAMNRFGDYTEEEFVALMLPRRARRLRQAASSAHNSATDQDGKQRRADDGSGELVRGRKLKQHELPYEPLTNPATVPAEMSWRGTGADGLGVMDQATCGSCWAFSAAGTMEGAWFRATGRRVSFSEQQIVDCSWGFVPGDAASNLGCDGGNHWAGIGHIVEAGGIALTADYQYKGQDAYCMANVTKRVGKFKGYARVPRYDDAALREALYSRGPIAISFDASQPSFRFYSSGVYREERCDYHPDGLDHDLVLVGYGSSPEGDYWEVKNSWSDHWGDEGYYKVAVDNHACGVTTDSAYAVVDQGSIGLRGSGL